MSVAKRMIEQELNEEEGNEEIQKDLDAEIRQEVEDEEEVDPRSCQYCGQYPCDCWRDV